MEDLRVKDVKRCVQAVIQLFARPWLDKYDEIVYNRAGRVKQEIRRCRKNGSQEVEKSWIGFEPISERELARIEKRWPGLGKDFGDLARKFETIWSEIEPFVRR